MISKLLVVAGPGSYLRLVAALLLGAMSAMAARAEVPSVTTNYFGNLSSGKGTKLYTLQGAGDCGKISADVAIGKLERLIWR